MGLQRATLVRRDELAFKVSGAAAISFGSHPDNGGVNCPAAEQSGDPSSIFPLVSQLIDFPFNNAAPSSSIGSISAANHVAFSPRGFDPGAARHRRRQALFLFRSRKPLINFSSGKTERGGEGVRRREGERRENHYCEFLSFRRHTAPLGGKW